MKITEFKIPVPWGVIAVKAWGEKKNEPILAFHGIQDNAASFDRILPLLPVIFYYICIDLPGHGKSSHLPNSLLLHSIDYLMAYKLVFDYVNRKPTIVLGHSFGAQGALIFTILYPECVKKLILLDSLHHLPVYPTKFKTYMRKNIEMALLYYNKWNMEKSPKYIYQKALEKLIKNRRHGSLSEKSAEVLLQRHLIPADDHYRFTLDPRLKYYVNPLNEENYMIEVLKNNPIQCPIMVIFFPECADLLEFTKPEIEVLKTMTNCTVHYIDGGHNEHLNNPESVAPFIERFLLNCKI